jgi:hypothetical protein
MDLFLVDFYRRLESYLNADEELARRLKGFKTFAGLPDGHYERARREGPKALVRAVRCYPFGGTSLLNQCNVVGIQIKDTDYSARFSVALADHTFSVKTGDEGSPHLEITLSRELFKQVLLGRYRWVWLLGMDEVNVECAHNLPHSDWITILEVLVAMQELVEFYPDFLKAVEEL